MSKAEEDNSVLSMKIMSPLPICQAWQRLAWVFFFASAMGLLEAICVIYLRQLLFPAGIDPSHIVATVARWPIEYVREVCTLIMLLAVALIAGLNWRTRVANFFFAFGVWDITYYVGLKWLAHWPSSWLEWDCLFLIPRPWYSPVLAPVLISGYFVLACCLLLIRESSGARLRLSAPVLSLQLLGFVLWYWSFVKDSDRVATQGYEAVTYSWLLFGCGLFSGLLALLLAIRTKKTRC
jgi:hypothetical protein